jgi:hypothetical protein
VRVKFKRGAALSSSFPAFVASYVDAFSSRTGPALASRLHPALPTHPRRCRPERVAVGSRDQARWLPYPCREARERRAPVEPQRARLATNSS